MRADAGGFEDSLVEIILLVQFSLGAGAMLLGAGWALITLHWVSGSGKLPTSPMSWVLIPIAMGAAAVFLDQLYELDEE